MNENSKVIVITILLAAIGLAAGIFNILNPPLNSQDFNFYESRLEIKGLNISETLLFRPNKQYHTLYRYFLSEMYIGDPDNQGEYVRIKNVECSAGRPYFKPIQYEGDNCYYFDEENYDSCLSYTEPNEYGCSFGWELGFNSGENYRVSGEYEIQADTIFQVNDKNYLKFIAYSEDKHYTLKRGKNFFIDGDVISKEEYSAKEQVIIYLPYEGSLAGKKIIYLKSFKFDNTLFEQIIFYLMNFIAAFLPAALFFFIWLIFGKEKSYKDTPETLSSYPKERRGWEVAAYFSPPFSSIDKKFFSSMLLELYHKKIIDIKTEKSFFSKKLYIKINSYEQEKLDAIEQDFLKIIEKAYSKSSNRYKKEGYLDLVGVSNSLSIGYDIKKGFRELEEKVRKIGKGYVSTAGPIILFFSSFFLLIASAFAQNFYLLILDFLVIFSSFFMWKSAILTRHKENYYIEYQHWQAFKNYLEAAPSIKEGRHKAVILWDHYLVYALALGVSKKAIKELYDENIINEKEYNACTSIGHFSGSFAAASGTSGGSGGGGGAGGGGSGGGGGGGR